MTICIAALYNNCGGVALISDQLTTAHFPIGYEFETDDIAKILDMGDGSCILTAGDVIFASEVIAQAKLLLAPLGDSVPLPQVAEKTCDAYQVIRLRHLVRNELESRGLTLDEYKESQGKMFPPIIQMIDQQFRTFDPGVELIIAGKDSAGCHIFTIQNPGDILCHDIVGFVAIGSGAPHALYSLIESNYKKSLPRDKVVELVNNAKKRSEVAPGVGNATKEVVI